MTKVFAFANHEIVTTACLWMRVRACVCRCTFCRTPTVSGGACGCLPTKACAFANPESVTILCLWVPANQGTFCRRTCTASTASSSGGGSRPTPASPQDTRPTSKAPTHLPSTARARVMVRFFGVGCCCPDFYLRAVAVLPPIRYAHGQVSNASAVALIEGVWSYLVDQVTFLFTVLGLVFFTDTVDRNTKQRHECTPGLLATLSPLRCCGTKSRLCGVTSLASTCVDVCVGACTRRVATQFSRSRAHLPNIRHLADTCAVAVYMARLPRHSTARHTTLSPQSQSWWRKLGTVVN